MARPKVCGGAELYLPDCGECSHLEWEIEELKRRVTEAETELANKLSPTDIEAGEYIYVEVDGKKVVIHSGMTKQQILDVLGYEEITISKEDSSGAIVTAHLIGYIETQQDITWSGLDPLTVKVNEEFDPLDGVSAIGCNDEPATVTVEE